jgi:two-component system, sensor histidine kinase
MGGSMDTSFPASSQQIIDVVRGFSVPTDKTSLVLAAALIPKRSPGERRDAALLTPRSSRGRAGRARMSETWSNSEEGAITNVCQTMARVPQTTLIPQYVSATEYQRELTQLLDRERTAHDELADVDRRKDEFLAMLGHELRNPLSDIMNAVKILEQLGCHDSTAVEMHAVVRRQSLHMATLIDDLLDISRISCGKILLQMGRIDLVQITRNVVADHQHHLATNQLTLVLDVPSAPIWVRGDATRLSQVVTNLLHNATKFTDPGGTISVCVNCTETFAALSVRDTGIGMLSAELVALFEPFRQGESSRLRSKGGLGLGLALSKRLVEEHGGVIAAASAGLGCGSMFSIRLPLDPQGLPEPSQPAIEVAATPGAHRILIVDDRRDARLTLTVLLRQMGQQVVDAESGAAALDIGRNFHPQIVLCDIGLPDMDGYAVARAMRADTALHGAFLVALTGYGHADDRRRALQAGFDRHLTKPISYEQLQELLLLVPGP